jgi:hexosaminidase
MAPNTFTYFDYYQSRDQVAEPIAIGGFLSVDSAYAFDPMPADLETKYRHHIIGAQGQLWTEYIETPRKAEYMAYPRMSALAEVVWTPQEMRKLPDFRRRLDAHLLRLQALDVNYRPPEPTVQP